ncbi:hypothetical protein HDU93_001214 [Gonapodya sp. JEL0774]|nr:hypothetical protein HDU93_001214 [Gonapodya sp. JEL0774]
MDSSPSLRADSPADSPGNALEPFPFSRLPGELHIRTFQFVKHDRTLRACRLACRSFEALATRRAFARIQPQNSDQLRRLACVFADAEARVHDLAVNGEIDPAVIRFRRILTSVREVDLRSISPRAMRSSDIVRLLQAIDLSQLHIFAFPDPVGGDDPVQLVEQVLVLLARGATYLTSLMLPNGEVMRSEVSWNSVRTIMERSLTGRLSIDFELPEGDLDTRRVAPQTLPNWEKLACLDVAAWNSPAPATEHGRAWRNLIPRFTSLTTLGLVGRSFEGSPTAFGPPELRQLFDCSPGLKSLFLETEGLEGWSKVLREKGGQLKALGINGPLSGIFKLITGLPNLTSIGLYDVFYGSKDLSGFESALCRGNLECLHFSDVPPFVFSKLHLVVRNNSRLRRLWLSSHGSFYRTATEALMNILETEQAPKLQCLHLWKSRGMERESFEEALGRNWEKFPSLNLVWVHFAGEGNKVYERDPLSGGNERVPNTALSRLRGAKRLLWDSVDMLDPEHRPLIKISSIDS